MAVGAFPNATWFLGDFSNIAISPNGVAALWTDLRLPSNDPPPYTGWGQDAFFALVDPPWPGSAAPSVSSGTSLSPSLDGMPLADPSFVFPSGGAALPGDNGGAADSAGAAPLALDSHHVDQLFAAIGQQGQGWMNPAPKPHAVGLDEDWLADVLASLEQ